MLTTLILQSRSHPEQGFRACLGILRLVRSYGRERLEAARCGWLCLNSVSLPIGGSSAGC
jgi:hypothetical protein